MSFSHPAFAPYATLVDALGLARCMADINALNAQAEALGTRQARGLPLRFVKSERRLSAREYETHILETGAVPTRAETWHDVLNALVWLRFPTFKSALNLAHVEAFASESGSRRGRRRDALTVLDESGVWVGSEARDLPDLLIDRAWRTLFCDMRSAVCSRMQFVVVGHALLEKALAPYRAMTGKCLILVETQLDPTTLEYAAVARIDQIKSPSQLVPLPIQGIPDWDDENSEAGYYADTQVFRPKVHGAEPD